MARWAAPVCSRSASAEAVFWRGRAESLEGENARLAAENTTLDELLWPVQPVGDVLPPAEHQYLLMRWARKKFKRLRAYTGVKAWWKRLAGRQPEMFVHWAWMRAFTF